MTYNVWPHPGPYSNTLNPLDRALRILDAAGYSFSYSYESIDDNSYIRMIKIDDKWLTVDETIAFAERVKALGAFW
jgi:hypothetical protein